MTSNRSLVFGLAYAIFFATLLKIAINVFSIPMVGYANNYDFIRSSSCTGVWLYKDGKPAEPDHRAPRNALHYSGDQISTGCLRSIDNAYAHIVRSWHQKGDAVDFREVGAVKLAVLALAVLALIWLVRQHGVLLSLAAVFYLVFGDMSIIPYFNSFYTEFSSVAGLYFLAAASIWLTTTPVRPRAAQVGLIGVYAIWLGLSKMQYVFLMPVLLAYCSMVWCLRWGFARPVLVMLGLALVVPVIFSAANHSERGLMQSVSMANKTNTFLWTVLPAATDQRTALEFLGMPLSCEKAIGLNWFSPGYVENNLCPEVLHVSRAKLALLFFKDPPVFFTPMRNALLAVHPLYPAYLATHEKQGEEAMGIHREMRATSMTYGGISTISPETFFQANLVLFAFGLLACAALIPLIRSAVSHKLVWLVVASMLAVGTVISVYALASSVFGDGYADIHKHAVGMHVGLAFQCAGVIAAVVGMLQVFTARRRPVVESRTAGDTAASSM